MIPCKECVHSGHGTRCFKDQYAVFVNGCPSCGELVNWRWYTRKLPCPEFEQVHYLEQDHWS